MTLHLITFIVGFLSPPKANDRTVFQTRPQRFPPTPFSVRTLLPDYSIIRLNTGYTADSALRGNCLLKRVIAGTI